MITTKGFIGLETELYFDSSVEAEIYVYENRLHIEKLNVECKTDFTLFVEHELVTFCKDHFIPIITIESSLIKQNDLCPTHYGLVEYIEGGYFLSYIRYKGDNIIDDSDMGILIEKCIAKILDKEFDVEYIGAEGKRLGLTSDEILVCVQCARDLYNARTDKGVLKGSIVISKDR